MKKNDKSKQELQKELSQLRNKITKLEKENLQLKHEQEEIEILASVVKYSRELINVATMDGKMVFLNEAGCHMLGIDCDDLEKINIMEVIPEHLNKIVESEVLPTIMKGEDWKGDLQYLNLKTGELVDVHAMTFSIKHPDTGEPWFLANVSMDITERKKAEKQKIELEKQILEAQKLESLGILAGGIAHDFNNLLMGVLGNADLVLMDLDAGSPLVPGVQAIQNAAIRLSELTKQMLAYSGKGQFLVQNINISSLVEEMAHLLEISMSKKVTINYNLDSSLPAIKADASQVRQVVMNLITNASEACGDDSGVVTLTTGVVEGELTEFAFSYFEDDFLQCPTAYLEVSDTGCGMDEKTKKKIFDPFFTTKFTGRGLGLAAVQGIMRGHKGAVAIYSEPEHGTTFKIYFPCTNGIVDSPKFGTAENKKWKAEGKILLVDDEEIVRNVGKKILESIGFDVLTANDGLQAVNIFREYNTEIDAVILDLTMPYLNGIEAFDEIKKIRSNVPILLSSGYNEQDATKQFEGKNLTGFLQKPYTADDMVMKLQELLKS